MSTVVGTQAARSLWADAAATGVDLATGTGLTTLNLATGAAVTSINVGTSGSPAINIGGTDSTLKSFGGSVVEAQATVTTVDATVTSAVSIPLANNTAYMLEAWIVGRRTDAAGRAVYIRNVAVFREAAGVATLQGAVDTALTRESTAGWNATISVTGNDVSIDVKGLAGQTINWTVSYTLRSRT
jgi:hypothetical protein